MNLTTTKMTMIYWKSDKFWLGKLLEHPEIMTQGKTPNELKENIKEAYLLMATDNLLPNIDRQLCEKIEMPNRIEPLE